MTSAELTILANIIGAVESGGQVYGNRNYSAYAPPYKNSTEEHTITLGWNQQYGARAKKLVQMIYDKDKSLFTSSIIAKLSADWVATRWNPSATDKDTLIKIISSSVGKQCQDEIFFSDAKAEIARAESYGVTDVGTQMMWVEIAWLGGTSAAKRIFGKISSPYTVDKIYATLKLDQNDTSNNNQVGDKLYQSRHDCCVKWIKQYVKDYDGCNAQTSAATTSATTEKKKLSASEAVSYATKLLKHWPFVYCPTLASFTTNTTPHKGDVVLFYRNYTFAHTGYVYKVDGSTYYTIEGNTNSGATVIANGGGVCMKSYSITSYPGTRFFRPDYSILVNAGIFKSVDEAINAIITVGKNEVGYLEKRSNSQLWDKTANAGSNNYTCYWEDVYPQFQGSAWCACWISAIFKHAIMGETCVTKGGANFATLSSTSSTTLIRRGATGSTVKMLQQNLNKLIGANLEVDGEFGPSTEKSVKSFQQKYNLEVDGVVGPATLGKIDELLKKTSTSNNTSTSSSTSSSKLNETPKRNGTVTTKLNVRSYAGVEYPTCSFSPLPKGTVVGICDTVKAKDGKDWYFIKYNDKLGFVSAEFVK